MKQLAPEDIDEILTRNGVGVLSLVDGDRPYAIPMSFGYTGDDVMIPMQLGMGYGGRKQRCIESNRNVCLCVYESDPEDGWRSVVITGEIYEIEAAESEEAFSGLADNAEFAPDLDVWGAPFEDVDLELFGIDVTDRSGRAFSFSESA
jgi:nitroimidazol reductase NimA-like FMN-containing flavoprotein (pyridoxamine 5'-phosphate oxidase superfamily)